MPCNTIVIVSADPALRTSLAAQARQEGFDTETAESLEGWLSTAAPRSVGCLVLDMAPGTLVSLEQLASFAVACASRPVLVLTAAGDVPTAVHAVRHGATDVVQRSSRPSGILDRIQRIVSSRA